jgi:hypothetical protein
MDVCRIGHSQEILYLAIKLAKSFENTFLSLPPILASVGNFPNLLVSLQEKLSGSDHAAARRQICSDVPTSSIILLFHFLKQNCPVFHCAESPSGKESVS